ncbi:MAG: polyhydroxyalkanoic acid system family protein [Gammaproteobacteria bacterium]|jgi:putative polyhydroxyalkanoate system protein|nr:hypothetical protein [Chromatiales bacterium]MDP6654074.1 polyhydroxyalkanoic acid system family protein [Gammaproteobacteria bacterium]
MSSIEFNKTFTMPREKLRVELDDLTQQLGQELQLNCEWLSEDCLRFWRNGAKGQINIREEEVSLSITLGVLMEYFRKDIERELQDFIDKHIY